MTGTEGIWLTAAAKSLTALALNAVWGVGTDTIDKATRGLLTEGRISKASRQYIDRYQKRHGTVQVLGMSKPVSLESVYTTVQLLDAQSLSDFETVEALEQVYRQTSTRRFSREKSKRKPGLEIADQEEFLTVLGGPGVGKTTFLRKIGLEALKGKSKQFQHACIPVFLELKRFDGDDIDIEQLVIEEFRTCGFPKPEVFGPKALAKGKLLVLLDGLDEVPSKNLTQVIRKIQDFVNRYSQNRFIASCRIAAYRGYFKGCTNVAIAEFNKTQIAEFIGNWFQRDIDKESGTAAACWELLQKPENKAALELAQTPLLLTFLCLVFDQSQNLPDNRSTLYRKALDILLEKWAAEKRIQQEEIYQGLHTDLETVLLSEIAYKRFNDDQLFFSKQEVIDQITTFLQETLDAPKSLNGKSVLHAIEVQQGILVARAEGIYSFSHLTIQEFLTARYIEKKPKLLEEVIFKHLVDARWRETFLLVSGLQDSADDLLLDMERQALTYIKTPRLQSLLLEIGNVDIKTLSKHHSFARSHGRALALALTLASASALVRASASHLGNALSLASARARDFALASDLVSDLAIAVAIARAIDLALVLNIEEVIALIDYLEAMNVIFQCKRAAIRVSQKVWAGIEERILSTGQKSS